MADRDLTAISVAQHEAIIAAIRAGDREAIMAAIRKNYSFGMQSLLATMNEADPDGKMSKA
jgi:DNA-binding GntR family transcriptional regulator